jgi:hypothetical protein
METQRQLRQDQRNHKAEREDVSSTKARQTQEKMTMSEKHTQIYERCKTKDNRFRINTVLDKERENLTTRHIIEMERFEETENDSRQGVLRNQNIRALKKKEARNQQGRELQLFKNTQRYTSMTTDEQRETISEFI